MSLGVVVSIYYSTFIWCNDKLKTQTKVLALLIYFVIVGIFALLS